MSRERKHEREGKEKSKDGRVREKNRDRKERRKKIIGETRKNKKKERNVGFFFQIRLSIEIVKILLM